MSTKLHWTDLSRLPDVLAAGTHRNRTFVIRKGFAGNPCGYVYITDEEAAKWKDYDDVDAEIVMHGGCTWLGEIIEGKDVFIGFDTSHGFDNTHTRSPRYVEEEVINIIDQLERR